MSTLPLPTHLKSRLLSSEAALLQSLSKQPQSLLLRDYIQAAASLRQHYQSESLLLQQQLSSHQHTAKTHQSLIQQLTARNKQLQGVKIECTELKAMNRSLKMDNKILIENIDRQDKDERAEREVRAVRKVHKVQDTVYHEMTNRVQLEKVTATYQQLKDYSKKLTEQNQQLLKEHNMLKEQIQLKSKLLQTQKEVVELHKDNNEKLNDVIAKMNAKITSLQQMNKALTDSEEDKHNSNKSTARKIGELYQIHKRSE